MSPTRDRQELGQRGEELAARFLEARGLTIVDTNVRSPLGELDIVAQEGNTLVFVEVKTRRSRTAGTAVEAVSKTKQRQVARMAGLYLRTKSWEGRDCRFDVVTIDISPGHEQIKIDLIQDAFQE